MYAFSISTSQALLLIIMFNGYKVPSSASCFINTSTQVLDVHTLHVCAAMRKYPCAYLHSFSLISIKIIICFIGRQQQH